LVEVTNFPAIQSVAGTVQIGNLPVDESGNVRIAGAVTINQSPVRFIGYTQATLFGSATTVLNLNRACNAEFPQARACEITELQRAVPPPPQFAGTGILLLLPLSAYTGNQSWLITGCILQTDEAPRTCTPDSSNPFAVACCGF
jgi:hypothetical protein